MTLTSRKFVNTPVVEKRKHHEIIKTMSDEVIADHNYRSEHKNLLLSLKSVVEGLLSGQSNNVWNIHGGLNRMCEKLEKILYHGLKSTKGEFGNCQDFWPYVYGIKMMNPVLAPTLDKINRAGGNKGSTWVRESLMDHTLASQLTTLVSSKKRLDQYYFDFAFLQDSSYFQALCICLKAIEQNKVSLLTELDLKLLNKTNGNLSRSENLAVPERRKSSSRRISSCQDLMALAPPFASPKQESILCLSDEHAVPSSIRTSTSPEETKSMARDSLRTVLIKSGSDSPTGENPGFSFYDSLNSDPLMNVEFENPDSLSPERSPNFNTSTPMKVTNTQKKPFNRSQSAVGLSQTSAAIQNIYKENEDFTSTDKGKTISRPEDIFSDSECPSHDKSEPKIKMKSQKGHKRSRSDLGGIKVEKADKPGSDLTPNEENEENTSSKKEGSFPQPAEGQSLINYLSSHDFHTCANLDKENAHFSISEALIAAIEQMKWNHVISPKLPGDLDEEDSDEEINKLKQRIRIRKRERLKEKARGFPAFSDGQTETASTSKSPSSCLSSSPQKDTDSSSSDIDEERIEITISDDEGGQKSNLLKSKGLSLSLASLYSDADLQKVKFDRQSSVEISDISHLSAESVAISLLKKFSEKQLPKASDLEWLVPESEVPQKLLPLPASFPVSPDDGENHNIIDTIFGTMRLRGNSEWAPPRLQIIFDIHPYQKRSVVMVKQNYRCAGCGTRVEPAYMKRFRYCEYLGKYFCQCCHSNSLSYIPGHIVRKWDFKKYPVSNFSQTLISRIFSEPYFNLTHINPSLFRKIRVLDSIHNLRLQLFYLSKFLRICKYSESLMKDVKSLPSHWSDDLDLYSLDDLVNIKNNTMIHQLQNTVTNAIQHVEQCAFCQGFGYICELCGDDKDIIFPYQLQSVIVCKDCTSCFHKCCYVEGKCPKCSRIEARRRLQEVNISESEDES